jgi:hypothetical protein
MGISPTTGQAYYSDDWKAIKDICRVLNIGEGKLAKITQELVEFYQEMVDREIDAALEQYYYVPLKKYRQVQPDGSTKEVFPGNIVRLARYFTAGLLLTSEFQGLDPNANESATSYIDSSRRQVFEIVRFNRRLYGQDWKANLRTMLPTMKPARNPEPNF